MERDQAKWEITNHHLIKQEVARDLLKNMESIKQAIIINIQV